MVKNACPEFVWSLEVSVLVSYMTATGIPRILQSSCQLPLRLVARPCTPVKDAAIKLTLNTNIPVLNLSEVFPGNVEQFLYL